MTEYMQVARVVVLCAVFEQGRHEDNAEYADIVSERI